MPTELISQESILAQLLLKPAVLAAGTPMSLTLNKVLMALLGLREGLF